VEITRPPGEVNISNASVAAWRLCRAMGQNPRVGGVNNPEDVIYGDFNYTQKMEPKNLSDWKRKIRNIQEPPTLLGTTKPIHWFIFIDVASQMACQNCGATKI